jgi:hypothetical protein
MYQEWDRARHDAHDQSWQLTNVGDWASNTFGGVTQTREHEPPPPPARCICAAAECRIGSQGVAKGNGHFFGN